MAPRVFRNKRSSRMIRHSFRAQSVLLCLLIFQPAAADGPEEVVVTATKLSNMHEDGGTITLNVFGEEQLQARNAVSLRSLNFAVPNVQIEDLGTARGIANIAIRGIGVNSSIASVDPAVGVFADGVYTGMNAGTLSDFLDVEAVEVLRGPQGTLYGQNVTGGAVLIRSREPADRFEFTGRIGIESGPLIRGEAAVSGPLVPVRLSARLAVSGVHDNGWFTNTASGTRFGKNDSYGARLSLRFTPAAALNSILRLEHGAETGDGPAGQNHALFERGSFGFSLDNRGYAKTLRDQITFETNWHTGSGTFTNIAAWRWTTVGWAADIDSTPAFVFHTRVLNVHRQVSDELRYAVRQGSVEAVTGLYFLEQNLLYLDERNFSASFRRTGGGQGVFQDFAAFASADWHLNNTLTLSGGLRFTHERKHARISRVRRAADDLDGTETVPGEGADGGNLDARVLYFSDTPFTQSWDFISPRIGLQWHPDETASVYASWSRAFRGGGANFRTSTLGLKPRAYGPETLSAFEAGFRQRFACGQLALALFHTDVASMQRETNLADPVSGVQQAVLNAGDARLYGGEIEAGFTASEHLTVSVYAGYVYGEYRRVTSDLNGDLAVDAADARLRIPRLAPLSAGVNIEYRAMLATGVLDIRAGYSHRDGAYYNDSNLGRLAETDILDTSLTYTPESNRWSVSLYGKNLTNVASWGGDTTLPSTAAFGYSGSKRPTFSPLNKGRVIGLELRGTL